MIKPSDERRLRSHPQNHHFGGFDQRGGALSRLQPHLFCGVRGDDRGDVLLSNRHGHLSEQAAVLDREDAADELIAAADLTEISAARLNVPPLQSFRNQAVDFAFRDAMMATWRLCCLDLLA